MGRGGGRRIYLTYTVTTRVTPALRQMDSSERHFNVSLTVWDKVTRQCPKTTHSEEKGELKRMN